MSGDKVFVAKESTSQEILSKTTTILSKIGGLYTKRYGYRVKISEGQPAGRVEYLHDAVGMTPASMNFGSAFSYGSWGSVWFIRDNFPCMVTFDGVVDYRLNPNDYTKRLNGANSDVANVAYTGNAMSALPCVFYRRWTEDGYYYFECCEQQYDSSYYADVHTKEDGSIGNYDFDAIFKGSTVDNKLRSLSGQRPMNSQTAATELTQAQNCGTKWCFRKWNRWSLIGDLITLITKSTNSQATIGQGNTTSGSAAQYELDTGTLNTAGGFFGYSDTIHAMKAFHQENLWGDRWDRCLGLVMVNGNPLVRMNRVDGDYNLTGEGYTPHGATIPTDHGWQKEILSNRYGNLPISIGGSETTFETDFFWQNQGIVAVAFVGGACVDGAYCGARCLDLNDVAGAAYWAFGASPALKDPI